MRDSGASLLAESAAHKPDVYQLLRAQCALYQVFSKIQCNLMLFGVDSLISAKGVYSQRRLHLKEKDATFSKTSFSTNPHLYRWAL